jgi:hypothetical protein
VIDDTEFHDRKIDAATEGTDFWDLRLDDGMSFSLEKKWGITPHAGDVVRLYGLFGRPIRGIVVNGKVAFYRTAEEEREHQKQENAKHREEKRKKYDEHLDEYEAKITTLPPEFQERIARFRRNNPDFWEMLPYELFCCEQAVLIATTLKAAEDISAFYKLEWEQQKLAIPDLSDDHSGDTFGASCMLAGLYVDAETRDCVDKAHGALCPMLGCKDYGCYSTENKTIEATEDAC